MGSLDGCGKCGNKVLTYGHFVHDETGEVIPEISCYRCGWRYIPPPKVCEPIIYQPSHKPRATRPTSNAYGTCRNCERDELYIVSRGLCRYCYTHRDDLEAAKDQVQEWAKRGMVKMSYRGAYERHINS